MSQQFKMEKAIDRANRMKKQASFTEGRVDSEEYSNLNRAFEAVTAMAPVPPADSVSIKNASAPLLTSWQMAGLALYNLGLLEIDQGNYDRAFEYFQRLIERYGFKPHQVQTALFMQAVARYRQDRFQEAVTLYNQVAQYYLSAALSVYNPNLDALESPLTAAKILEDTDRSEKFRSQVHKAIDYYWNIINSYEGSPLADAAVGKLASAFLIGDLADSAVAALSLVKDENTGRIPPLVQYNIAMIQQKNQEDYKGAEKSYRAFVKYYPDHPLAPSAMLGLGVTLYKREEYEKARQELSVLEKVQRVPFEIAAEGHYLTALCFEKEDKWQRAIGEFDYVWANYAISDKGMEGPIHKAEYYQEKGEKELAARAFEEAENDYRRLMDLYSARMDIAARTMSYLARCYVSQNRWEEAVETLTQAAGKFPRTPAGFSALPQAAEILTDKLNRPGDAARQLRTFLVLYPDIPQQTGIAAYIDSLERISR